MPWLCVDITNGEEAQTRAQAQAQVSWGGDGGPLLPPLHLFRFALRAAPREQGCAMKHTVNRSYLLLKAEERSSLIDAWLFRHQLYLAQLTLLWWVSRWRIRPQCSRQGSIPESGRFPGEGSGNPLQYSCLRNLMDRGDWQATVHGVARVGHDLVTILPHHQSSWGLPGREFWPSWCLTTATEFEMFSPSH